MFTQTLIYIISKALKHLEGFVYDMQANPFIKLGATIAQKHGTEILHLLLP